MLKRVESQSMYARGLEVTLISMGPCPFVKALTRRFREFFVRIFYTFQIHEKTIKEPIGGTTQPKAESLCLFEEEKRLIHRRQIDDEDLVCFEVRHLFSLQSTRPFAKGCSKRLGDIKMHGQFGDYLIARLEYEEGVKIYQSDKIELTYQINIVEENSTYHSAVH